MREGPLEELPRMLKQGKMHPWTHKSFNAATTKAAVFDLLTTKLDGAWLAVAASEFNEPVDGTLLVASKFVRIVLQFAIHGFESTDPLHLILVLLNFGGFHVHRWRIKVLQSIMCAYWVIRGGAARKSEPLRVANATESKDPQQTEWFISIYTLEMYQNDRDFLRGLAMVPGSGKGSGKMTSVLIVVLDFRAYCKLCRKVFHQQQLIVVDLSGPHSGTTVLAIDEAFSEVSMAEMA